MKIQNYLIGRMARESGCKIQTIRYYEQIELMPNPTRSEGNQRIYTAGDLERLVFIRHSRALGFSIDNIRQLLDLADDPAKPCEAADHIARLHLREVDDRITKLTALKIELERMIKRCQGGQIGECQIIGVLANHELCMIEDHEHPV